MMRFQRMSEYFKLSNIAKRRLVIDRYPIIWKSVVQSLQYPSLSNNPGKRS